MHLVKLLNMHRLSDDRQDLIPTLVSVCPCHGGVRVNEIFDNLSSGVTVIERLTLGKGYILKSIFERLVDKDIVIDE